MTSQTFAPGSVIADRFEIEALAGAGGMGAIYRAKDRATGGLVALKVLRDGITSASDTERFMREARVLAGLRHPSIAAYVAHGHMPDGRPYLAMEWLSGEVLSRVLRRGPLRLARCLAIAREVTAGLAAAHRMGVVHRDIKPSNIFLCRGAPERAMLLDFGIARHNLGGHSLTRTGVVIGTPEYMAPEQARAEREIGPSADVFSLGCVLYECLTGKSPFGGGHVAGLLAKILFEASPRVHKLRRDVPPPLDDLIARMLEKDAAKRPKDAIELEEALATIADLPLSDEPVTISPASSASLTGREQVLVSIVVASAQPGAADLPPRPGDTDATLDDRRGEHASMIADLSRFGARIEWLADGSLVAVISREGASASDIVAIAARCALAIQERWAGATIALATGRGVLTGQVPMGETIDRAAQLLRKRASATPSDAPPSTLSGVALDDVSTGLLGPRFLQVQARSGALLVGEQVSVDESRLLLGRPTPCVGREQELSYLETILSSCIGDPASQVALVTAPPGVGKSRLRHELLRRVRARYPEVKTLLGRGDPLSAGSPYGIIGQATRSWFQIHGGVDIARQRAELQSAVTARVDPSKAPHMSEFLGELCGVPFPDEDSPPLRAARSDPKVMNEEIKRAFCGWLHAECEDGPVLLVLEDLHWGDPLTVKLIESTARDLSELPLMVLALARPEVTDLFPRLWSGLAHAIPLRPLTKKACERLVKEVLGAGVSAATLERIVGHAEGNALYLEELIRAAAEDRGAELPETLLALLQARFLRLPAGARRVLRTASVFGLAFWTGGVRALYGEGAEEVASWLRVVLDAEIVLQRSESRFPNDTEMVFRHALMRETAYSLLTDDDREAGHRLASVYLEEAGEADPAVIAEHAQRGGDAERAIQFYSRAAEQSWERNDLDQLLACAERGVACGASGEALGGLLALTCLGRVGKMDLAGAEAAGSRAVALLPPGSVWWCRALQQLAFVLPHLKQPQRMLELIDLLLATKPAPGAESAHIVAASIPLAMAAIAGERRAAESILRSFRAAPAQAILERDAFARGTASFGEGWFVRSLEPDPFRALLVGQACLRAFEATEATYNLAGPAMLLGSVQADIGDFDAGEATLRGGLALSTELRDSFLIINLKTYLVIALATRPEPAAREEARRLADDLLSAGAGPAYEGVAQMAIASAALGEGNWSGAEEAARASRRLFSVSMPPYTPAPAAILIDALREQGRAGEACSIADEELRHMDSLGGVGWTEIPLRVAGVSALLAAGRRESAEIALRTALDRIELRARAIPDPALRSRYVSARPENARAFALATSVFGLGARPTG